MDETRTPDRLVRGFLFIQKPKKGIYQLVCWPSRRRHIGGFQNSNG